MNKHETLELLEKEEQVIREREELERGKKDGGKGEEEGGGDGLVGEKHLWANSQPELDPQIQWEQKTNL